jgi:hypothetical protein
MWFPSGMKVFCGWMMCLLLCAGIASAAGNKGEPAKVSFHVETEATDNPKMIFPHVVMGDRRFFRRIPDVSSKDFVAFTPFPAEDQASYGVVFQLKDNALRRLAAVTSVNQGNWMVCQAFGRVVDAVLIDAPVDDGAIVVWKNLTIEEIRLLDESLPRIGEKRKK